jgi:hypothetical protein
VVGALQYQNDLGYDGTYDDAKKIKQGPPENNQFVFARLVIPVRSCYKAGIRITPRATAS